MEKEFKSKEGESYTLRELVLEDAEPLGIFFESLSEGTRSKYGPHPLTKEEAFVICRNTGKDNTRRFIILNCSEVIGYFLLDFNPFQYEAERYRNCGIELNSKVDPVFAPCMTDAYQNKGIAGNAMKILLQWAESNNLRRIVLMGGTQEQNAVARSFYKKCGFKEYTNFYTENNGKNNIDMMLDLHS